MTANDLTTQPLPLLVQGRPQVSFVRDPLEGGKGLGGGANNFKGRWFNLPLGDSLLRGAGYFVIDYLAWMGQFVGQICDIQEV